MKLSNITLALAIIFAVFFSSCSTQDDPLAPENLNSLQTDPANESSVIVPDNSAAFKGGGSFNSCGNLQLPMFNPVGSQFQSFGNTVFSHDLNNLTIDVIPAGGLKITALEIWDGDFNATLPLLPTGTPDVTQFNRQFSFPTGVTSHRVVVPKSQLFPCHGFAIHMDVAFFGPNNVPLLQKSAWLYGHRQGNGTVIELCIPTCGPITTSFL